MKKKYDIEPIKFLGDFDVRRFATHFSNLTYIRLKLINFLADIRQITTKAVAIVLKLTSANH